MFRPVSRLLAAPALVAGFALALLPRPAAAVGVDVGNGETLEIAPLAGYCVLDEARTAEAALIRTMRGAVGETMRVVLAFGDCTELVELREGKRPVLDHFGQVLLLSEGANIARVGDSRAAYLASVAKPFPAATIEEIAANGEAQLKAGKPADAPKPIFAVIGRDDLAIYIGTTSLQGRGDHRTMVAGVAGIGLIRQVPVNINLFAAYDGTPAAGKATFDGLVDQMSAGIADLQFTNEDGATPAALPVPNRNEWKAMGSTALVGAVIGGVLGGIGAIAVVLLRRRRRPAAALADGHEASPPPEAADSAGHEAPEAGPDAPAEDAGAEPADEAPREDRPAATTGNGQGA